MAVIFTTTNSGHSPDSLDAEKMREVMLKAGIIKPQESGRRLAPEVIARRTATRKVNREAKLALQKLIDNKNS